MTSVFKTALLFIALALIPVAPSRADDACAGAPWIKLEVIASEIAGSPIGVWIEIDQTGCVLSHYPYWRLDAGTYQRQMSAAEIDSIKQHLEQAGMYGFDATEERTRLELADQQYEKAAGARGFYGIEGADIYRLQLVGANASNIIEWRSPAAELAIRQSNPAQFTSAKTSGASGLQRLVDTLRLVQTAASDPRKIKIAEVTP